MPAKPNNRVRIIGGAWRSRVLRFPAVTDIRPTPDRVRETLFNWLMPILPGARVLDLFAGSGALGLEAVSRGAASAELVERDPGMAAALREVASRLAGGEVVTVTQADALGWLASQPEGGFELAFVDPPFDAGLWDAVLPLLVPKLAPSAWLYIESPPSFMPALGSDWQLHRHGSTREVRYALYRRGPELAAAPTVTLPPDPAGTAPAAKA